MGSPVDTPVRAAEVRIPTPTPVPPLVREVVLEFAGGHRTVAQEWEKIHAEFDAWREGLLSCDATSLQTFLRQFAGRFIGVSETDRRLPRDLIMRGLADSLIAAAEQEEEAIRHPRDAWRPGDPTVFETVDIERSSAAALRKEVEDKLSDLAVSTDPSTRREVDEFSFAFQQIDGKWDALRRTYDAFRSEDIELNSEETVRRLNELVDELRDIVVSIRRLPTTDLTRHVAQNLAVGAEAEDLALRKLRGTFEKSEETLDEQAPGTRQPGAGSTSEVSVSPAESSGQADTESTTGTTTVVFLPRDPTLFDAFDSQMVVSNALRRHAVQALAEVTAEVVEATSEETQAAVKEFTRQYDLLVRQWDDFHRSYDSWRQSDGGCERSAAIARLGQLALRFGQLTTDVRELPRATFLRPLGELCVEAAEGEEEALRLLRNTWRPFDSAVYGRFDEERNQARRLRRQVAAGIENLLDEFGISLPEPESE